MQQRLYTIFGGSGFIGRYVVQKLAGQGHRVRVAVRHPNDALFLKPLGAVGQVQLIAADVTHAASVARAVAGADGVVNLVGILYASGHQTFDGVQGEGAGIIAQAAAAAGVRHLVHVSAIGADEGSPSKYARSKAAGEAAVRAAFPGATILRPSVVFGAEDQFFNRFAAMARYSLALPLIGGGETRFQPVYVGDVADAAVAALQGGRAAGKTYELGGPRVYSFREILAFILAETWRRRALVPVPFGVAKLLGAFLGLLPRPQLTLDQVRLLERDNIVGDKALGLADLGVAATPVEAVVPKMMVRFRAHGAFTRDRTAANG